MPEVKAIDVSRCALFRVVHAPRTLQTQTLPSQMAGQSVKKATETLVNAAQQASVEAGRDASGGASIHVNIGGKVMNKFREELEIAEKIAQKERELEQARQQLTKIRKGQQ